MPKIIRREFYSVYVYCILCVFKHEITCENGMLKICSIMNESNSFRQKKGKKKLALNFHGILNIYSQIPKVGYPKQNWGLTTYMHK